MGRVIPAFVFISQSTLRDIQLRPGTTLLESWSADLVVETMEPESCHGLWLLVGLF
jgi:hypothetical protein